MPDRNDSPERLLACRMSEMRSVAVRDPRCEADRPGVLSLAGGVPVPELADFESLRVAANAVLEQTSHLALSHDSVEGDPALRAQIAAGLRRIGAAVTDEAPVVTAGSQQGLDLVARAMLEPGDRVLIERPACREALGVLGLTGARRIGVPGDEFGLRVQMLPEADEALKLVCLMTNFADPSGATLSLERRMALLRWAVRNRVFVLEDDPYGTLRIDGERLPPLIALATEVAGAHQWCGYMSSSPVLLASGLQIGFAVLPDWLRRLVLRIRQTTDPQPLGLGQAIAVRLLASGRLEPRLQAVRETCRERRDLLCEALARTFGNRLQFFVPEGGMFVWGRFRDGTDTTRLLPLARDAGMDFVPGEAFYDGAPDRTTLRLCHATAAPEQLAEAVSRLAVAHRVLHRTGAPQDAPEPQGDDAVVLSGADPCSRAHALRDACIEAALEAWEYAGISGLCAEGRWEVAIEAIRSLDPAAIARKS